METTIQAGWLYLAPGPRTNLVPVLRTIPMPNLMPRLMHILRLRSMREFSLQPNRTEALDRLLVREGVCLQTLLLNRGLVMVKRRAHMK